MSLPSSVGLPNEMMLGNLDYSLPPDAKSYSVKVQPSNISSVTSPSYTATASSALDLTFPSQNIIFDLPAGASPSMFLDSRFTTLGFRMTINVVTAGTTSVVTSGFLRSHANSFFDRMYITSQNGQIIEDIGEYGIVNDTLINLQMNNSVRDGTATQYGFSSVNAIDSQGHSIAVFTSNTLAAGQSESHSYAVPLLSGSIGVLADKFLNIGRTSKLQVVLQTTSVLPLTIVTGTAGAAGTFSVTLSDFSLQCEYVDIGLNALKMLDQTLVDGKSYIHGVTYRTSSTSLPATSGSTSLLAGIRASSVKSLFARFVDGGAVSTDNSINGKYDSKNPMINNIQFNVGGVKYPQNPINPLLNPASAFSETQKAIGSFNNSQFQSCIPPSQYCKLSRGGAAQALTLGASQEYTWNLGTAVDKQSLFIFGENVEVCARRGLLSGLNCTSAPIFVEMNIATAPTNAHTLHTIAMLDQVLIHSVTDGDISVRI
jgi:hypothetical protein